jgi:competence protein ComGC
MTSNLPPGYPESQDTPGDGDKGVTLLVVLIIVAVIAVILFPIIFCFAVSFLCMALAIFVVLVIIAVLAMFFLAPYYYMKMKPEVQTHGSYKIDDIVDPEERSRKKD